MRFLAVVWFALVLLMTSCWDGDTSMDVSHSQDYFQVEHLGPWSVRHDLMDDVIMKSELVFLTTSDADLRNCVDSLNYSTPAADSLRFNMKWHVGSSAVLVLSVTIPDYGDEELIRYAKTICDSSLVMVPAGLRSVYLSDRTGIEIDEERASTAVEPPPHVTHHLMVYYQQDSTGTLLEVVDSLVVDFNESNADSMAFTFIHRGGSSVVSSTAGIFRRDSTPNQYICFADSSGMYTGVFSNDFQINIPYLDSHGRVCVQSRLTSAYLSGDGYCPVSGVPSKYSVKVFLPDSISSWTPMVQEGTSDEWHSGPGGILCGLPIAIGNYAENSLFPRYRMLTLAGSPISYLDSIAVKKIASVLRSTLDFTSAEFTFVEIINPDGPVVISVFGGMLFSRGSLENLVDVSAWDESLANGIVPLGSETLIGAAEAVLVQSLQLDPVLSDMLAAWIPLRYYIANTDDESGAGVIRDAYLKYYLFNTETLGENGSIHEYALGDPKLQDSHLRPFVAGGKGVIVMEYLNSLKMLNRLPYLLQDFRHASSGNFWLKVSSSLRVYRETSQYTILRNLLYHPGIPQIHAGWSENDEKISIDIVEIQPGIPFNLKFDKCQLHLQDTVITRPLIRTTESGFMQCRADLAGYGAVVAIDLNPEGVIPVDIMYTMVSHGEIE